MCTLSKKKASITPSVSLVDKPLTHVEWREIPKPQFKWNIDLLCDRMQSPENAGLIIRTGMGLGVRNIFFLDPLFKWNSKKMNKLSRSAAQHVPIHHIRSISAIDLSTYTHIVSLEYSKKSRSLYHHDLKGSTLLILGAEYDGIQEQLLQFSNKVYHIPLVGEQSSINAAQAFSGAMVYFNASRIRK